MRFDDRKIRSIGELIDNLKKDYNECPGEIWFRGQSNIDWKLIPTINRKENNLSEMDLIKRFKQNATLIINQHPAPSQVEWLFQMRHYSVPTRLLDWSESPLVAAYFAVDSNDEADGVIWLLLPIELNKLANIEPDYPTSIPSFGEGVLESYEPEKFFAEKTSKMNPVAFLAPRNSPRMQAQHFLPLNNETKNLNTK
jgi:hypothetical protein